MSLYVLVPLIACVASAVFASAILSRGASETANRQAAFLVAGVSFWAFGEILWHAQSDPALALIGVRASALGWIWLGPAALHLLLEIGGEPLSRVRRALPFLYGVSALFLLVDWFTPWIHPAVVRQSWGWAYEVGPVFMLVCVHTAACLIGAVAVGWRAFQRSRSNGEREHLRWLAGGICVLLFVASLTDGLLPAAGIQLPRLGTASFAVIGAMIAWSFHRYGYSLLAPGAFAGKILETLPDGVALLRLDGRIRSANGAMARLLGGDPAWLPGLRLADRLVGLSGDLTEEAVDRQCEIVSENGGREPVSISSTALHDRQGAAIGLVVVARDLREVVALRNRLLLSGRLAAVGELAAGIAHEINNPLAYVRANLGLLRQHWEALGGKLEKTNGSAEATELVGEGEEMIDESLEGVERAVAIVRDVRGLAHGGRGPWEPADLNALIDGVLRMAAPQLRDHVRLEKRYMPGAQVFCAPQELQQVFLNLVLNAGQAVGRSGTIRIVTEREPAAVVVRVEDDGCGIPPDVISRIFDPFFTTKPVGQGTGLGLGIAYEIVRRHGGEIAVESEPGRGACFRVRLPVDGDTIDRD
ncbi:MAG: ATP-binding protein [Myxococcales bacterium]|nr:ATP-binding protein [Myxococcales bacterium]